MVLKPLCKAKATFLWIRQQFSAVVSDKKYCSYYALSIYIWVGEEMKFFIQKKKNLCYFAVAITGGNWQK
jgi:hypothetical protein